MADVGFISRERGPFRLLGNATPQGAAFIRGRPMARLST